MSCYKQGYDCSKFLFFRLPQLYFPTTTPLINTLSGLQTTTPASVGVQPVTSTQPQQSFIDYATLAAVAAAGGQNAFALHPTGDKYAVPIYCHLCNYQTVIIKIQMIVEYPNQLFFFFLFCSIKCKQHGFGAV